MVRLHLVKIVFGAALASVGACARSIRADSATSLPLCDTSTADTAGWREASLTGAPVGMKVPSSLVLKSDLASHADPSFHHQTWSDDSTYSILLIITRSHGSAIPAPSPSQQVCRVSSRGLEGTVAIRRGRNVRTSRVVYSTFATFVLEDSDEVGLDAMAQSEASQQRVLAIIESVHRKEETTASAQARGAGLSPAETVRQLFRALEAKDWLAAGRLVHPRALASFRAEEVRDAAEWHVTPMISDSSLSPPVRAYFDSMQAQQRKSGNPSLAMFGGVPTIDSLARIPADRLLALYWRTRDPKPENYDNGIAPRSERSVLGAVIKADTVAYVVYRETLMAPGSTLSPELYVIEVRRDHEVWRIMLNRDIGAGSSAMITTRQDST